MSKNANGASLLQTTPRYTCCPSYLEESVFKNIKQLSIVNMVSSIRLSDL